MHENEKHMRMMEIYDSISHVFFDVTISKADIRNPLRYLLMNAVASRSASGSFQLPLT